VLGFYRRKIEKDKIGEKRFSFNQISNVNNQKFTKVRNSMLGSSLSCNSDLFTYFPYRNKPIKTMQAFEPKLEKSDCRKGYNWIWSVRLALFKEGKNRRGRNSEVLRLARVSMDSGNLACKWSESNCLMDGEPLPRLRRISKFLKSIPRPVLTHYHNVQDIQISLTWVWTERLHFWAELERDDVPFAKPAEHGTKCKLLQIGKE